MNQAQFLPRARIIAAAAALVSSASILIAEQRLTDEQKNSAIASCQEQFSRCTASCPNIPQALQNCVADCAHQYSLCMSAIARRVPRGEMPDVKAPVTVAPVEATRESAGTATRVDGAKPGVPLQKPAPGLGRRTEVKDSHDRYANAAPAPTAIPTGKNRASTQAYQQLPRAERQQIARDTVKVLRTSPSPSPTAGEPGSNARSGAKPAPTATPTPPARR